MITQLIPKREEKRDDKIEITRLKEVNIANNELLKASKRLAKAYNING